MESIADIFGEWRDTVDKLLPSAFSVFTCGSIVFKEIINNFHRVLRKVLWVRKEHMKHVAKIYHFCNIFSITSTVTGGIFGEKI